MKAEDAKKAGTSFLAKAFIAFAVVHLLILPQMPASKRRLNQVIGEDSGKLRLYKFEVARKLRNLESVQEYRSALKETARLPPKQRTATIREWFTHHPLDLSDTNIRNTQKLSDTQLMLQIGGLKEKLLQIDQEWIQMDQARFQRTFKIPGTDASLGESEVKNYYPLALSLTVISLYVFRRRVLSASYDNTFVPPFWSAPIPFGKYSLPFRTWLTLNVSGLGLLFICAQLFIEFAFRDEFVANKVLLVMNLISALLVAGMYIWATFKAIQGDPDQGGQVGDSV